MAPEPTIVDALVQWMRSEFPNGTVEGRALANQQREDVVLFRARDEKAPAPAKELEISFEAFEDYSPEAIIADLKHLRVADALRAAPQTRLMYRRDRRIIAVPYHS